jgi:hypothetical protein
MHERESLCDPRAICESAHNRLGNGFIQCRLFDRQLFHCEHLRVFGVLLCAQLPIVLPPGEAGLVWPCLDFQYNPPPPSNMKVWKEA